MNKTVTDKLTADVGGYAWEFWLEVVEDGVALRGRSLCEPNERHGWWLLDLTSDGVFLYPGIFVNNLPLDEKRRLKYQT